MVEKRKIESSSTTVLLGVGAEKGRGMKEPKTKKKKYPHPEAGGSSEDSEDEESPIIREAENNLSETERLVKQFAEQIENFFKKIKEEKKLNSPLFKLNDAPVILRKAKEKYEHINSTINDLNSVGTKKAIFYANLYGVLKEEIYNNIDKLKKYLHERHILISRIQSLLEEMRDAVETLNADSIENSSAQLEELVEKLDKFELSNQLKEAALKEAELLIEKFNKKTEESEKEKKAPAAPPPKKKFDLSDLPPEIRDRFNLGPGTIEASEEASEAAEKEMGSAPEESNEEREEEAPLKAEGNAAIIEEIARHEFSFDNAERNASLSAIQAVKDSINQEVLKQIETSFFSGKMKRRVAKETVGERNRVLFRKMFVDYLKRRHGTDKLNDVQKKFYNEIGAFLDKKTYELTHGKAASFKESGVVIQNDDPEHLDLYNAYMIREGALEVLLQIIINNGGALPDWEKRVRDFDQKWVSKWIKGFTVEHLLSVLYCAERAIGCTDLKISKKHRINPEENFEENFENHFEQLLKNKAEKGHKEHGAHGKHAEKLPDLNGLINFFETGNLPTDRDIANYRISGKRHAENFVEKAKTILSTFGTFGHDSALHTYEEEEDEFPKSHHKEITTAQRKKGFIGGVSDNIGNVLSDWGAVWKFYWKYFTTPKLKKISPRKYAENHKKKLRDINRSMKLEGLQFEDILIQYERKRLKKIHSPELKKEESAAKEEHGQEPFLGGEEIEQTIYSSMLFKAVMDEIKLICKIAAIEHPGTANPEDIAKWYDENREIIAREAFKDPEFLKEHRLKGEKLLFDGRVDTKFLLDLLDVSANHIANKRKDWQGLMFSKAWIKIWKFWKDPHEVFGAAVNGALFWVLPKSLRLWAALIPIGYVLENVGGNLKEVKIPIPFVKGFLWFVGWAGKNFGNCIDFTAPTKLLWHTKKYSNSRRSMRLGAHIDPPVKDFYIDADLMNKYRELFAEEVEENEDKKAKEEGLFFGNILERVRNGVEIIKDRQKKEYKDVEEMVNKKKKITEHDSAHGESHDGGKGKGGHGHGVGGKKGGHAH